MELVSPHWWSAWRIEWIYIHIYWILSENIPGWKWKMETKWDRKSTINDLNSSEKIELAITVAAKNGPIIEMLTKSHLIFPELKRKWREFRSFHCHRTMIRRQLNHCKTQRELTNIFQLQLKTVIKKPFHRESFLSNLFSVTKCVCVVCFSKSDYTLNEWTTEWEIYRGKEKERSHEREMEFGTIEKKMVLMSDLSWNKKWYLYSALRRRMVGPSNIVIVWFALFLDFFAVEMCFCCCCSVISHLPFWPAIAYF